jgi:hypothetical protein
LIQSDISAQRLRRFKHVEAILSKVAIEAEGSIDAENGNGSLVIAVSCRQQGEER